jgi:ABC-type branched-subunit amino acid transport system ATPase component
VNIQVVEPRKEFGNTVAADVTHLGLASHATVIDKGQIVYTATIEELKTNDNVRRRYLAL